MLLAYLIHDIIHRDAPHQSADTVNDRDGHNVVFVDDLCDLLNAVAVVHSDRVFLHHMLDLRDRGIGDHLLQRQDTAQSFVVIYYINIIDLTDLLGLLAHLFNTFGHTPILVHHDHLRTHQTTGGILIVFQQIDNITGLLYVFDVRKDLFLRVLIQFTHQIYRIIRIHVIDESLGDQLVREFFQELVSIFLV